MTLPQVRESVIRIVSAALKTDEDRYEPDYIDDIIHQYRAEATELVWQRDKRINSNWTQQFIATYSKDLQDDDCFVRFACPPLIALGKKADGAVYVGSIKGHTTYRKVTSRADLANSDLHRFTKSNERTIKALYSDGFWEIHGDPLIKELRIDGKDVTLLTINLVLTAGDLTLNGGDINLNAGEINITSGAVGDILKHNATGFTRFARGTSLQVLRVNAGATDLEYFTPPAGGTASSPARPTSARQGSRRAGRCAGRARRAQRRRGRGNRSRGPGPIGPQRPT